MTFQLDSTVPVPTNVHHRTVYPFHNMQVGDSFATTVVNAKQAAYIHAKRHGVKFTVRNQPDGTIRVWRIA